MEVPEPSTVMWRGGDGMKVFYLGEEEGSKEVKEVKEAEEVKEKRRSVRV
jgi:hypothetical protein